MKKYLGIFLIILTWLAVLLANFSPHTWLSGWDNLHPELNFSANIWRSVFAVWQQYQGLGLLGGMGHAADLGRQLLLLAGSLVIPANFLRPLYFFAMLLAGPLGVYFLLKDRGEEQATFGGLFYLLNLATIQMFYAPFEAFVTQYGFLPWLIYVALRLLKEFTKKNLFLFVLINLLAVPQAYIPTLFVVYLLALGWVLLTSKASLKRLVLVAFTTLIINAFWLLPFGYFSLNNINVPIEAKANQMATQEDFLRNKEFGNIQDVTILRGFWFNSKDAGTNSYMMQPWRDYFQNSLVLTVGYALFGIILLGLVDSFRSRHQYRWIFLGLFLLPVTLLLNNTPPFSWIDAVFYKIPLIAQIFRFPFTKFSILAAMAFSIYFGLGTASLLRNIRTKRLLSLFLVLGLVFLMLPVFQGNLFFKSEKLSFPQEYFDTVKFFNSQDANTRIANFPQPTYWGWEYYNWGYQGSGFWWYGIDQPMLDRAFDVWSREDENYYWEISQAVYAKNLPLFESVLNKYRVNWLLVDGNIINPSSPKALYTNEIKELIKKSDQIKLIKQIGQIGIYSFDLRVPVKSFISIAQNLPSVGPSYKWSNLDQGYFDVGDYKEGKDNLYFYRTLFTGRTQGDLEFDPDSFQRGGLVKVNDYPTLSHRDSYLIKVKIKAGGSRNLFWIEDLNSRRAVLETYIQNSNFKFQISNFVLPPTEPDGLGYAFHLDNQESLEVYKIDYFNLITLRNLSNQSSVSYLNNFTVYHPNPAFYKIDLNSPGTLILSQSFDKGWVAIGATNHQLINNWANGWDINDGSTTVYLFYWPQFLEFAGFAILTIFIIGWIIKLRFTSCSHPMNSVQT